MKHGSKSTSVRVEHTILTEMAPTNQKMKAKKPSAKSGNPKFTKAKVQDVKKKRKWVPEQKVFKGNLKEGQGFAFYRKEKVKHEYNRLLRKEKKKAPVSDSLYKEEYPEHLKHLYMAEAEKLRNEAWTNRMNRMKSRMKGQEKETDLKPESDVTGADAPDQSVAAAPEAGGVSEPTDSLPGDGEAAAPPQKESFPMSNRMRKRMLKKTSSQRAKEAFEMQKEKQRKKKETYLQNKQQREEALQRYKQKKMETFQMLSKKTKKGQPNLNLQMEYLLQKIQGPGK